LTIEAVFSGSCVCTGACGAFSVQATVGVVESNDRVGDRGLEAVDHDCLARQAARTGEGSANHQRARRELLPARRGQGAHVGQRGHARLDAISAPRAKNCTSGSRCQRMTRTNPGGVRSVIRVRCHHRGAYQMGEVHARSWIVAGTSFRSGRLLRTAS
jgi:hypothetical protein